MLSAQIIEDACRKIDAYWDKRGIKNREVVVYWYGGEPTSMGISNFRDLFKRINDVFVRSKGYTVKHTVLTSLVSIKSDWFDVFHQLCSGELHTSYDGDMRGERYMAKWERKISQAIDNGLEISTLSVVNSELLKLGGTACLDYLTSLGVDHTGWLPFMWNDQNDQGSYAKYAPTMENWSTFMIELSERWLELKRSGANPPSVGQLQFVLHQKEQATLSNIAGQTLFLMPNGDFVLPDYREGWKEFMQPFGNIIRQDFEQVLASPARRAYLRRQVFRNHNPECLSCEHADKCVMEFFKSNRPGDECFGGKRFVEWVLEHEYEIAQITPCSEKRLLY